MNREEIARMAREAGFLVASASLWCAESEALERFAALVAAAEREACAAICDPVDMEVEEWERLSDYRQGLSDGAETCAEAIRERGEE